MTLNGALTGMVAMCAGCNVFEPWAALLVGVFSGAVFTAVREGMNRYSEKKLHPENIYLLNMYLASLMISEYNTMLFLDQVGA